MIQDVLNSIKVTLHERLSNPLLGSFLVSLIVINFHFFVILLANEPVLNKFNILALYFNPKEWEFWLKLFVYPGLITAFYIFVLPYPTKFVYGFVRKRQKEILDIRKKTEDEFPITQEEARELRLKHYELERYYQSILKDKIAELENLKRNFDPETVKNSNIAANDVKKWNEDYSKFMKTPSFKSFKNDLDHIFAGKVAFSVLNNAGMLSAMGLIEQGSNQEIVVTEKGRYFADRIIEYSDSNEIDVSESEVKKSYKHLIDLFKILYRERGDGRKLRYNESEMKSYLNKNFDNFIKYLESKDADFVRLLKKNTMIIEKINTFNREDEVEPYITEIYKSLPKTS